MTFRTIRAMFRRLLVAAVVLGALAGCGGSEGGEGPSATIQAADADPTTTSTTAALTPEEEVEAAYLRSWEVYAEAMRELDDSRLAEVFADELLDARTKEIADLRAAGHAAIIDIDHDYVIDVFVEDRALVTENYFNRSVLIDATTEEHLEPVPNEVVRRQYELRRLEGSWKVVSAIAV